jgi:lipid II:glycine glycyltransferase (peptidoglycan interpeptide bridge formation enzyme)
MRLATALIIYFGDTATYKYGGSLQAHRNVMAPYLLHFEAMLTAKSRGHRWYDFYGIAKDDNPDDLWAGFSAFKRKFGGRERNYVPALDFVYDQLAYEDYRRHEAESF